MEMNGGSSAPYLASTLASPCFVLCLIGVETEDFLDYQGRAGDHFHCTVEPSPGHTPNVGVGACGIWGHRVEAQTPLHEQCAWQKHGSCDTRLAEACPPKL